VLAAGLHLLFAEETAAQEGKKVVLLMLATGLVFVGVIALGELSHWVAKQRRARREN
jgi:NhaP-type Na+/H+ or K+/H+ antiporter